MSQIKFKQEENEKKKDRKGKNMQIEKLTKKRNKNRNVANE